MHTTLVDTTTAAARIANPDWLFVDCRFNMQDPAAALRDYQASHIPGALRADLDADLSGPLVPGRTGRHPLPAPDALVRVFSEWGIGPRTQVVAYDESTGAMAAARLWWLLKWAGHDPVAVLDGGLKAWRAAGLPCSEGAESRRATPFAASFRHEMAVDARQVLSVLKDPDWVVLDARAADRYHGQNETIDPTAGHIAGAFSAPYAAALREDGTFKAQAEVSALYRAAMTGHDATHTVFYCGSGVTATHGILACAHAGLGTPRLYAGSWSEWITDPSRPTAR